MKGPFLLTAFDREVLSVLMSHGGWNASARARLAQLARRYGVSSAGLARVVAGLAEAARDGRLQEAVSGRRSPMAPSRSDQAARRVGARSPESKQLPRASRQPEGPSARAMDSSAGTGIASMRWSRTDKVLLAIVASSLLVSVALVVLLVVMVMGSMAGDRGARPLSDEDSRASELTDASTTDALRRSALPTSSTDPTDRSTGAVALSDVGDARRDDDHRARSAQADGARSSGAVRPPAVPAPYPRLPDFQASLDAPAFMQAMATARSGAATLDALARDPRSALGSRSQWRDVQQAIGWCWPRLDPELRRRLLDRTVAVIRTVEEPTAADALIEPFRTAASAAPSDPAAIRSGAWASGVIGTLLTEPGLSPEVVQAIASSRLVPADGDGDAFERFASGWLDRALESIADLIGRSGAQDDFDRMEAWIEAQSRVRDAVEMSDAALRAVEALLRRPLRVDLPGTSADIMGRLLRHVDWRIEAPTTLALRRRFEQWLADPAIEARSLWALGSMLQQGRSAAWFAPDMVVGERDSMQDRRAASERIAHALVLDAAAAPAPSRAPKELLARWDALLTRVQDAPLEARMVAGAKGSPSGTAISGASAPAANAMRDAIEIERLLALGTIGAMLIEGRTTQAAERLAAFEQAIEGPVLSGLGPAGRSVPAAGDPSSDGTLDRRLEQARTAAERVDAIRRRRTESANDLGPRDASRLVREAYMGDSSSIRLTAQGVIVDSFASGPRVAQELVDQHGSVGLWDASLGRFIERLTGERLPPHSNPSFRTASLSALLRHRLRLAEHAWHGVNELLARSARHGAERLEVEGGAVEVLRDSIHPLESCEAMASLLRTRAGSRAVLRPVPAPLEELDRRDEARRSLAEGSSQRWVAAAWRMLELEAFLAAADRPAMNDEIAAVVARGALEASRAATVLDQAVVIERTRIQLQRLRLLPNTEGAT